MSHCGDDDCCKQGKTLPSIHPVPHIREITAVYRSKLDMDDVIKPEAMALKPETAVSKLLADIPRGRPKSGRLWKSVKTERYSTCKQVKRLKTTWAEKMSLKNEKRKIKDIQGQLTEERAKKKQLNRQRAEEKKKQKLLNERKSEITQPIKSTKIKKLKKKQLRMIETR